MTSSERQDKVKRRSDMACTNCRARKLKCENKDSVPPCRRCAHDHKPDCQFVSVADDKSRATSEPEQRLSPQFTHTLASVPGVRSQNSGLSPSPFNIYRPTPNNNVRPSANGSSGLFYPNNPYDGHWTGQNQGPYPLPSSPRPSYPQPTGAGLVSSPYPYAPPPSSPYAQQSFACDARTSTTPHQNMYYPMNTLQDTSQGVHSPSSYYQTNGQPNGVVYSDPTVPGNNGLYQYPQ